MALTSGSKILVSDISTALGGKIDTAGTGLSKSGTTLALSSLHSAGGTIGASENGTLGFGGPFTMPYVNYDAYGRVTGGGTRTMTMPSAPSGGTATALSNVAMSDSYSYLNCSKADNYGGKKLPSGGTWYVYRYYANSSNGETEWFYEVNSISGGSTIKASDLIAIRVA